MTQTKQRLQANEKSSGPWWRHGMMWLVVGGPATVVVAGILTAYIAISGADIVIEDRTPAGHAADTPAVKARNHAVTPTPTPAGQ